MARKPKALTKIDNRSKLIDALGFVSFASQGHDNEKFNYVRIKDGILMAADDTIAIGVPVEVDMELCLHGDKFKSALEQCGDSFQFTQLSDANVSVKSEKFKANIGATDVNLMSPYEPDKNIAVIDDRIKSAVEVCNPFVTGKGERVITQCGLLKANTAVATNGHIAVEYWHGIDLPPVMLPKRTLTAISKLKKKLVGFGFSYNSATFHYEDSSFLRSQLYDGSYPDTDRLFIPFDSATFKPLPDEFFKGIEAIEKFVQDDTIYFHTDHIGSDNSLELGANYKVPGVIGGWTFSAKYWEMVKPLIETVHFPNATNQAVGFRSKAVRGVFLGKR